MKLNKKYGLYLVGALFSGVLAISLVACGSSSNSSAGSGTIYERALAREFAGEVVTVFGPARGPDELLLEAVIAQFELATGIDVQYTGSGEFENEIRTRVTAGDTPDVVDFPQPGLLQDFVQQGDLSGGKKVIRITDFENLSLDYLQGQYTPAWLAASTLKDANDNDYVAGVWHRTSGKSQVFYNKKAFDTAGYQVPTTYEELVALTNQIKSDGSAPWCFAIGSGGATGWPFTDWVEAILVNTQSGDVYDGWVDGTIPFSDPRIKAAFQTASDLLLTDGNSYGGREYVVGTSFGDIGVPMFSDPPQCYLHRQGNFIFSFSGFRDATPGVDFDAFAFPPPDGGQQGYVIAGDLMAAFDDRPAVAALMEYFTKPDSIRSWISTVGGQISPHKNTPPEWYANPVDRSISVAIGSASLLRFDGSDLQPGAVGAGTFWTEGTEYVAGRKSLDAVLAAIDASWPN